MSRKMTAWYKPDNYDTLNGFDKLEILLKVYKRRQRLYGMPTSTAIFGCEYNLKVRPGRFVFYRLEVLHELSVWSTSSPA